MPLESPPDVVDAIDKRSRTGHVGDTQSRQAELPVFDLAGKRVTILGVHYAPETTGNAPYTTALAQALTEAGAGVRVITGVPHYPQWRVLDVKYRWGFRWSEHHKGVDVTRVRHFVPANPNLLGRVGLELSFLAHCVVAMARDRSDVLIAVTPTLSGLAAALLCRRGRPIGVLIQDLTGASAAESGTASGRMGALISKVEYWLVKKTDLVGVITPRFAEILAANGVDIGKLVDLPNFTHVKPVDATRIEARRHLSWPEVFTVVHTGNMGMKQGLECVIEAARLAATQGLAVRFMLVGDGNQRQSLEQLAHGCDSVRFIDPLNEQDYPYALAAADVLLVNERSGVREMSLPSKLTSYTVAGRPIIAAVESDGITAEALNQYGSALICKSGDPSSLLDGIRKIMNSNELVIHLTERAELLNQNQYTEEQASGRYQRFVAQLAVQSDRETANVGD